MSDGLEKGSPANYAPSINEERKKDRPKSVKFIIDGEDDEVNFDQIEVQEKKDVGGFSKQSLAESVKNRGSSEIFRISSFNLSEFCKNVIWDSVDLSMASKFRSATTKCQAMTNTPP